MKENLSESKVFDADIARATMTISEYLSAKGIAGGVSLDGSSTSGAARLAADQGRKYEMGGLVAQGGMGAILDAKDCCVRRHVAMKVMLSRRQVSDDQILRFIEEAQITGQLEHPNIVPVHELGVDADGNVFYTMKYVRGRTLKAILADLRSAKNEVVREWGLLRLLNVYQRVCEAVAFAHSKGVIHRDLKPENIMVGDFGEVLVMDWGLAKVVTGRGEGDGEGTAAAPAAQPAWVIEGIREEEGASVVKTMSGAVLGTPQYMSPEQALGQVEALDGRTDVYALGAILYELLTLRPPVQGKSALEIMQKVVKGDYAAPSVYDRESTRRYDAQTLLKLKPVILHHCPGRRVPPSLAAVAMKALAVRPEQRYLGVLELQREVEAYLHGFATMAEQAGAARQVLLLIKRHRTLAASILAIIVALTAGLGVALHQRRQAIVAAAQLRRVSVQAAPRFLADARTAMQMNQWDEAATALETALGLDGSLVAAQVELARLHIQSDNIAAANKLLAALRKNPSLSPEERKQVEPLAAIVARLADQPVDAEDREALAKLGGEFHECSEHLLAAEYYRRARAKSMELRTRLALASQQLAQAGGVPELSSTALNIEIDANGTEYVNVILSKLPKVVSLEPLRGLPLRSLSLSNTGVYDLEPLRGMKLHRLYVNESPLHELSPLSGMPLTSVNLNGTKVGDLTPLQGMKLQELYLARTEVSDLSPLAGMPINRLDISQTKAIDLSALKGMPLHYIRLDYTFVEDISPLHDMPVVDFHASRSKIANIQILSSFPLIRCTIADSQVTDLGPLHGLPLAYLSASGTGVSDLSPLTGAPLEVLILGSTKVTDVSPLKGMPLRRLLLPTGVRDLSPLAGAALEELNIDGVPAADLAPLRGMPLKTLRLSSCRDLRNGDVIGSLRSLETLTVPASFPHFELLRGLPNLKVLDTCGYPPFRTAEKFWADYDRAGKPQP